MSLQIWLPLINNLNNQGCNSLISANIQSGVSTSTDGKLGSCYKNTGTTANVATTINFSADKFSLCAWVRIDTRRNNWCRAIGLYGNGTYMGLGCEHTNGTSIGFHYYKTIDGTNTNIFDNYPFNSDNGVWVHYTMVYDGTKYYIYKNGTVVTSANANRTNIKAEMTTLYLFGGTSGNYSNCSLNDVRLYDHALSPKEIKEISKGLVVHFPLNDQYNLGAINKYSGDNAEGMMNSSSWTKSKLSNERGWNYKYTYTGDGNNKWLSCEMPHYSFTAGKRYYYSIKVRCNKWNNGSLSFRAARSSNDYGDGGVSVTICSPSLADGKWHEYSISQIVNSTYTRSGTSVTCSPVLEFYTSNFNGNGTVYDMDFDLKDAQVVESDNYIPFIQNEYISSSVLDVSGYRNNGEKSGTISVVNDTPKYNISTYFPSGTGIFAHPAITLTSFTISFWAKHTATGKMVFGSNASTSSTNSSWYWYGDKSFKFPLGEFYYSYNAGTEAALLNTWVHFVAVYNGSNVTVYRNGVNEGNKAFTGSVLLDYLSIGHGYTNTSYLENSYMSDFRLYCTALSANDVLELYNKPISIDNSGKVYALEYNEV